MQSVARLENTGWLRYVSSAALAVAMTFGGVTAASAQDDDEEAEESADSTARQALQLIQAGKKAYKAEEFEKAHDHFKKAYELNPSPSILVPLGRTSEQLGEIRNAIEYYKKFLEKKPDAEKIGTRIEKLRAKLPASVKFSSTPSKAAIHQGAADGKKLGETPFQTEVNPGETTFVAVRKGHTNAEKTVELQGDSSKSVSFELEKVRKKRKTNDNVAAPPPSSSGGGDRMGLATWGWGSAAAGVAGIGTGVVFSILANSAANDVNNFDRGASGASRNELQGLKDTANSRYRTSLIAYSAGGALTALGAGMLTIHFLTRDKGSQVSWGIDGGVRDGGAWAGFRTRF